MPNPFAKRKGFFLSQIPRIEHGFFKSHNCENLCEQNGVESLKAPTH